jgi:hypothetical protein
MHVSGEMIGIGLGVLGVILTIYYGAKGAAKKRSQRQKVGSNSKAVQSGRDTNFT